LFFSSCFFAQNIYHESILNVNAGESITIDVFTDLQGQKIIKYNLFYKNSNQEAYYQINLNSLDNIYYSAVIPYDFINSTQIQYYIELETSSNIRTIPEVNPISNPLVVNISNHNTDNYAVNLKNEVVIISPQPNEKVYFDDLVIVLSYYDLENIDYSSIEVFIDDVNLTKKSKIKNHHLILYPPKLEFGKHTIRILMKENDNSLISPIEWSFLLLDDSKSLFQYSGKVSYYSINNSIDNQKIYSNISNFYFNGVTEWTDFHVKFKKSSLENVLQQPYDRYNLLFKHNIFDFNIGDFYPQFNQLVLNGTRVRGFGFDLRTNFFQLNLIHGQLNRAVHANIYNALTLNYSSDNILNISRDNYEFENQISGLRLGLGNAKKFNFGLNLVKVKDDIQSVDKYVNGSIISLDAITSGYDSDLYIDCDDDGIYNSDNQLYSDNNNHIIGIDNQFDDIVDIIESSEFITYQQETVVIDTCGIDNCMNYEGCLIKQNIWNIDVLYEDLEVVLNHSFNDNISINYLEDNWVGSKPKDNFVVGTDMKFNFSKLKINSGVSISLLNENIWNDIISIDEFDTYSDEYNDCYYGRTYDDGFINNGYSWSECDLYQNSISVDNSVAESYIQDSGLHINDIPNPEDFEEVFHYNFDAIPTIPFYDLVQKRSNNENVTIMDVLNSPEVAYNFDVRLLYPKHTAQFGVKKIGTSFTSLANPYLQSDTHEKYFNERVRLFTNRILLFFSLKSIDNGLSQESASAKSSTNKYDFNINFYPSRNLPQLTLNYSFHTKKGGEKIEFVTDEVCQDSSSPTYIENCIVDTRINTETINSSVYLKHDFTLFNSKHNLGVSYYESEKNDLLSYLSSVNPNYISPSSNNNNYNFSLKSYIDNHWNTDIYLSNSSFNFSVKDTEYYQKQDIYTIRLGFSFRNKNIIDNISSWLDYSKGEGTSSYSQYGLKLTLDLNLYENLLLSLNLRHYYKSLSYQSLNNSHNSILRINLSYNF
tara:strand:- start:10360 stop:13326 length:2967 start_codon:yes stop_codon:yes gene_type:complete